MAAAVLMVIAGLEPVQAALATSASASVPTSILSTSQAQSAWGYLEDQATSMLAVHGLPTSEQYARSLVRSYIFVQLINIIDEANSGATLSSQDQGALTYLEGQVDQERGWTYLDAYAKYINFAETQQDCSPGTGAQFTDGSTGMGGFTCGFDKMFGNTPTAAEFTAAGFAEAFQGFTDPTTAAVFFDTANSLSWWGSLPVLASETPAQQSAQQELQKVLQEKLTELGREVLSEVGTALFEMASDESGTAGMVIAAISLGLILASGIWNSVNATDTESALETQARTTPSVGPNDLAELTTGSGMPELLYVVLAQTLPSGTSIPSSASQSNSFPCSFDSSAACSGYTFASDPDYVASRYPSGSTAPPHTSSDPDFLLSQQGSSAATLSTTLQNPNTYLVPWENSDSNGNPQFYDQSSARDVQGISEGTNCNAPTVALGTSYPPLEGYSSYIHDNMFVTSLATCGAGVDGSSWLYNPGIRYVDWQGNWWVAWYQDGTFMHVKVANAIGGSLTPGNESTDAVESPCVENFSVYGPPYTGLSKVGGPDCLFASAGANLNGLDGQSVLVDGQLRVVNGVVDCYQSTGWELIGIKSYCSASDGTGNEFQPKAVYLQEGVSTDWTSISASEFVKILFDLPGTFSLGTPDPRAMAVLGVDTCAGRTDCTGTSNFSNCYLPTSNGDPSSSDCFVSPTIDYKASAVGASGNVSTQNWSATLAYPTAPLGTAPVVHGGYEGNLTTVLDYFTNADPSLSASDFSATIDWGDGSPASDGAIQTLGQGKYVVVGYHTYADEGSYPATVNVKDQDGKTLFTQHGTVAAMDTPLSDASLLSGGFLEAGTSGVREVATFEDANPSASASDFTATIDWGDGSPATSGKIGGSGGYFIVYGGHQYAEEGEYPMTVTISDDGGATATASGVIDVGDAALEPTGASLNGAEGNPGGVSLSGTEGQPISGATVATFEDNNPSAIVADYLPSTCPGTCPPGIPAGSVVIDWGDGSTSPGAVTETGNDPNNGGATEFSITGSHTYAEEGMYSIKTTITDEGGSSIEVPGSVTVTDGTLTPTPASISLTEGQTLSGAAVATFADENPGATAADFTSGGGSTKIDWGDGTSSSGTVTQTSPGQFSVSGSHTYSDEGTYPLRVVITDDGGSTVTAPGSVVVADAALTAAATPAFAAANPVSGVLATISDQNPDATAADFTSGGGSTKIDWGDGTSSSGTVTRTSPGQFSVSGSHTYSALGPYAVTVSVTDDGGATATATTQVVVFAFPVGGAFVIGDGNRTNGTPVTFWSPNWRMLNSVSGGAPSSFKGFEDGMSPPACGSAWTTDPGNSAPPPSGPLPTYMGVIVSSQVTQSGSVVAGDIAHIAVVKTGAGYAANVGHAGTGTIVAQAC